MTADPSVRASFAPHGYLRASLNLGNPILANTDNTSGKPFGVSIDLAMEFGRRLGVEVELVAFDTAAQSVHAVTDEKADIGFFAIDPVRGASIAFTSPYVLIEGFYLVRAASPVMRNADVDQAHNRVVVGNGSAYDLFLRRELAHAQIVRAPSSPTVVALFLEQNLEVAAGVRNQLEEQSSAHAGLRLLPERFMVIEQAMGLSKSRGEAAALFLNEFVESMKRSSFVAESLARHKISGATVAPING